MGLKTLVKANGWGEVQKKPDTRTDEFMGIASEALKLLMVLPVVGETPSQRESFRKTRALLWGRYDEAISKAKGE